MALPLVEAPAPSQEGLLYLTNIAASLSNLRSTWSTPLSDASSPAAAPAGPGASSAIPPPVSPVAAAPAAVVQGADSAPAAPAAAAVAAAAAATAAAVDGTPTDANFRVGLQEQPQLDAPPVAADPRPVADVPLEAPAPLQAPAPEASAVAAAGSEDRTMVESGGGGAASQRVTASASTPSQQGAIMRVVHACLTACKLHCLCANQSINLTTHTAKLDAYAPALVCFHPPCTSQAPRSTGILRRRLSDRVHVTETSRMPCRQVRVDLRLRQHGAI